MSLQYKLALPILALIIALLGTMGVFSYRESAAVLEASVTDNMRGEAEAAVRALGTSVKGALDGLHREAAGPDVLNFLANDPHDPANGQKMSEVLKTVVQNNHLFDRVVIADDRGTVVATAPIGNLGDNYPAQRDYFRRAMSGEEVVTPAYLSPEINQGVITVAQPVSLNGRRVAVIFASIQLKTIHDDILRPITIGKTGYAFAVGQPGVMVMHKDQSLLFREGL